MLAFSVQLPGSGQYVFNANDKKLLMKGRDGASDRSYTNLK
jgi:hypothetical protein